MMNPERQTPLPEYLSRSVVVTIISDVYGAVISRRNLNFDRQKTLSYRPKYPVISIGGIRAGGAGKTPLVMHIAQQLISDKHNIAFLSRGYRRKDKKDRIVVPYEKTNWESIGDEPAMIHANIPQSFLGVSSRRVVSAKKLEQLVPPNTVFLLDDGFQHRKLERDLDVVCLDETILSDRLLPSGYLREPLDSLKRADVLVLTGSPERLSYLQNVASVLSSRFPEIPVFTVMQKLDCWVNACTGEKQQTLPFKNPAALCGIARPQRFFQLLDAQGVYPVKKMIFPDHYIFSRYDIESIHKLYSHGLVATEKDAFRLMNNNFVFKLKNFWYLKIKLEFETDVSLNRFNRLISNVVLNF